MTKDPHAHYLDGEKPDPLDFLMQVVVPTSPRSATRGDVVVTVLERGIDQWAGVWRLDTNEWEGDWRRIDRLGSCFGTRAELVQWAMAQDAAAGWIFDEGMNDFVPLG